MVKCFKAAGISAVLIDDGLKLDKMHDVQWHKNFTPFVGRILRIERLAEAILDKVSCFSYFFLLCINFICDYGYCKHDQNIVAKIAGSHCAFYLISFVIKFVCSSTSMGTNTGFCFISQLVEIFYLYFESILISNFHNS